MTAKRPPKEKPGVSPGDKALREKAQMPAKETTGVGAAPVVASAMMAKQPPKEKPSVAPGDKTVREKGRAPSKETAGIDVASRAEPQRPAAAAPTAAAGAMTAKRPPKEKPSVAAGDKTLREKDRVPAKKMAGTGAGGKAMRAKDRGPARETPDAAPARKAAREKSLAASKKGGAGKSAPRLPASTPPAATTAPAPKKPPRRGDPRASARRHARLAIETLAAVMADPAAAPTMRISAATTLLQWAYGKPTTDAEGAGGKSEQVIRLAWATAGKP